MVRVDLGPHVDVAVAETFWERLRGVIGRSHTTALLLPTRSIHSIGVRRTLTVVALDAEFRVLAARRLKPGSVYAVAGARWMLELPGTLEPPPMGTTLRFIPNE